MPRVFSSIFTNDDRNEGIRSLRLAWGSERGSSLMEHTQSRAARRAARRQENRDFRRELTPTGGKGVYNQWIHCDLIVIF